MPDITMQQVNEAVGELRREVTEWKEKDKQSGLSEEKFARINAVLDQTEAASAKVVALETKQAQLNEDIAELKTARTELEELRGKDVEKGAELKGQITQLEAEIARGLHAQSDKNLNFRETEEFKALNEYCRQGDSNPEKFTVEQKALLRSDIMTDGGFLTTTEMDSEIMKTIEEIDQMRAVSRVRTIGSKSINLPVRTSIPTATYEGEAETGGDSTSGYINELVTPFRMDFTTPITKDLLMDAAFDMQSEINGDAAEAFAQKEGEKFLLGSNTKEPEGLLINADVIANVRDTAASGVLDADAIILLTGDLKVGYNPSYQLNRRTLALIRTFKSTTGQFLWSPGLNGPVANTLNGFTYALSNSMPDVTNSALSIAFGDFRRGYTIVDRTGMTVIRDELTQKKRAIVEFTMLRWNTGMVTLPEAIKILRIKA